MGLLRRRAGAARVTAEGVTIPSGARDVREVYPDPLTTRQRWLLGLGALMLDPKHGSCARLHPAAVVHPDRTAREYRASLKSTMKAVPELARFTAALERALRAESGGGSMSTRLFVGEALEEVSITGARAWATRRSADGHAEDVGFVRKKDGWYIRPLARRPGAGRG